MDGEMTFLGKNPPALGVVSCETFFPPTGGRPCTSASGVATVRTWRTSEGPQATGRIPPCPRPLLCPLRDGETDP